MYVFTPSVVDNLVEYVKLSIAFPNEKITAFAFECVTSLVVEYVNSILIIPAPKAVVLHNLDVLPSLSLIWIPSP